MDLDYRVLSNAGLWWVGRLQTDADRARVVEALATDRAGVGAEPEELSDTIKVLAPRWFVMRSPRPSKGVALLQPRTTLSWLRGPMTRGDLRRITRKV